MRQAEDYDIIDYTKKVLERCEPEGDCLIWQGAKHRQGYGIMAVSGPRNSYIHQTTTNKDIYFPSIGELMLRLHQLNYISL